MIAGIRNDSVNLYYPESDWQLFKQFLNVWFNFAYYIELPFRFSRRKLPFNIAALINQGKADIKDLKFFSKKLQVAVVVLLEDYSRL